MKTLNELKQANKELSKLITLCNVKCLTMKIGKTYADNEKFTFTLIDGSIRIVIRKKSVVLLAKKGGISTCKKFLGKSDFTTKNLCEIYHFDIV